MMGGRAGDGYQPDRHHRLHHPSSEGDLLGLNDDDNDDDPLLHQPLSQTMKDLQGLEISVPVEVKRSKSLESASDDDDDDLLVALDPLLLPPPVDTQVVAHDHHHHYELIQKGATPPAAARPPRQAKTLVVWIGMAAGALLVVVLFVTGIALVAKGNNDEVKEVVITNQRLVAMDLLTTNSNNGDAPELIRDFTLLGRLEDACSDFFAGDDQATTTDGVENDITLQRCELHSQALRRTYLELVVQVSSIEDGDGKTSMLTEEWLLQQNKTALIEDFKQVDPFFANLDDIVLTLLPDYPTTSPSSVPSLVPSAMPTIQPSSAPSPAPTNMPTRQPTNMPTRRPTLQPTLRPTLRPTLNPVTVVPVPAAPTTSNNSTPGFRRNNGTFSSSSAAPTPLVDNIFRPGSATAAPANLTSSSAVTTP